MSNDLARDQIVRFTLQMLKPEGKRTRGPLTKLAEAINMDRNKLSAIINGFPGNLPEDKRRAITNYFNVDYESALDYGKALLDGKDPADIPEPLPRLQTVAELEERGFLAIPFSQEMKLAAGRGGDPMIPYTDAAPSSPVLIHGPSIGRRTAKGLQAFRVGGDSMEPVIGRNGIVVADTKDTNIENLKKKAIYVIHYEPDSDVCHVKWLSWVARPFLLIESENDRDYPRVTSTEAQVTVIGRVIWAWREFT
jgi:hypothetical protein